VEGWQEEVEKVVEALLKASERVEEEVKKRLGERAQDLDLEIVVEVDEEKRVDASLEVKGLRSKYSYEEVVEEALDAGMQELERRFTSEGQRDLREA